MQWPQSPTTDLIAIFGATFAIVSLGFAFGLELAMVALTWPLERPWTIVTSVYAHAGLRHLLANVVGLAIIGFALERRTSRLRFHAFVLGTGALAGIAQVLIGVAVGQSAAVLGASGAVLALYGYALSANRLSGTLLERLDLDRRTTAVALVLIVLAVTVLTAGPGVAVLAHAVGFALGLLSGRLHLLRVG